MILRRLSPLREAQDAGASTLRRDVRPTEPPLVASPFNVLPTAVFSDGISSYLERKVSEGHKGQSVFVLKVQFNVAMSQDELRKIADVFVREIEARSGTANVKFSYAGNELLINFFGDVQFLKYWADMIRYSISKKLADASISGRVREVFGTLSMEIDWFRFIDGKTQKFSFPVYISEPATVGISTGYFHGSAVECRKVVHLTDRRAIPVLVEFDKLHKGYAVFYPQKFREPSGGDFDLSKLPNASMLLEYGIAPTVPPSVHFYSSLQPERLFAVVDPSFPHWVLGNFNGGRIVADMNDPDFQVYSKSLTLPHLYVCPDAFARANPAVEGLITIDFTEPSSRKMDLSL